jgi:hypothetical protein
MRHKNSLIWVSAIACVHLVRVTPALYRQLALRLSSTRDPLIAGVIAETLGRMHTPWTSRLLARLLAHPVAMVRLAAFNALADRGEATRRHARSLARGAYWEERARAAQHLGRHGDASDVPFMLSRLARMLGGPRKVDTDPPEIAAVVSFLLQHRGRPDVAMALARIPTRAARLRPAELAWMKKHARALLRR